MIIMFLYICDCNISGSSNSNRGYCERKDCGEFYDGMVELFQKGF